MAAPFWEGLVRLAFGQTLRVFVGARPGKWGLAGSTTKLQRAIAWLFNYLI
jgi:hypothetical protein